MHYVRFIVLPWCTTWGLSFCHVCKLCVLNTLARVIQSSSAKSTHLKKKVFSSIFFLKNQHENGQSRAALASSENGKGVFGCHWKVAILWSVLLFSFSARIRPGWPTNIVLALKMLVSRKSGFMQVCEHAMARQVAVGKRSSCNPEAILALPFA